MELSAAFKLAPVYAIYDTQVAGQFPAAPVIDAWLDAGIRVIQYRHKGNPGRRHFSELAEAARLVSGAGAIFIVNDRADLALLAAAQGVHLGQDDLPVSVVRRLLPVPAIIGHSTHNLAQVSSGLTQPIDYLALGPIFSTTSKQNPDPVVGLELIRQASRITQLPLVAIGGITRENLQDVLAAGAHAAAIISGLVAGCRTPADLAARARDLLAAAISAGRPAPGEP